MQYATARARSKDRHAQIFALLNSRSVGQLLRMLAHDAAVTRILQSVEPAPPDRVGLEQADSRILAEPITAGVDLPPFDNSSMDGYAIRAEDTRGAAATRPVCLRLVGRIPAGESFSGTVAPGECVRIFTGSPMPRGADAVVMQEDTRAGACEGNIEVTDAVSRGENVRHRGEDVRAGAALFDVGEALTPARVALLAAAGVSQVLVGSAPVVGVMATGSELVDAGRPLGPGQIYESNRLALAALSRRAGARSVLLPVVRDSLEQTGASLREAFQAADAVITCGGVSVGEMDFVKRAFEDLGGELSFWRVAIKPGKPFVFGTMGRKFLFGLPGNPVSAFVTFLLLVRPALRRWQGERDVGLRKVPAVTAESFENHGDRPHFVRVRLDKSGQAHSTGPQASHMLSSLAAADALVEVPAGEVIPAGTSVPALVW